MTNICRFLAPWLLIFAPLCHAASRFDGTWRGTYNSLDYERPSQAGDDLEQRNKGTVTGEFTRRISDLGNQAQTPSPQGRRRSILNGKTFGDRACFDVVNEYDDMRWCVTVSGDRLSGTWSGGPEGGPILGGAGTGARFYKISGRKVAR